MKNKEKVSLYIFRKENDKKIIVNKNVIDIGIKYIIGRRINKADIILEDLSVSKKHLEITFINSHKIIIKDIGSTNGTFVNGEQISPYKEYYLNINDSLCIGNLTNEISFEDLKNEQKNKINKSDENNKINENKNKLNDKSENKNKENKNKENKNIIKNKNLNENVAEKIKINEMKNKNENKKSSDSKIINNYYKNNISPQKKYRKYSSSKSKSRSYSRERSRDRDRERNYLSNRKSQKYSSNYYNKNKKYSKDRDSYEKVSNDRYRHHSKNKTNSFSHSHSKRKTTSHFKKNKFIPSYIIKKEDNKEKINNKNLRQIMLYKEYLQIKRDTNLPKLLPVLISRQGDDNFKTNINFKIPISTGMTKFLKRGLQAPSEKNYYDGNYYNNY